ncbi:putative secreted RxLR effector protein [Phytophthora cinnamomi]|uniref:putative secreted RxLR effector protein n=1 Tax=Phytophthora cinnamomi TaxID=4785 RepID=UPI00355A83F0|nr:putative secreted RxLR effector protein [Phytophthora cinnamomi]
MRVYSFAILLLTTTFLAAAIAAPGSSDTKAPPPSIVRSLITNGDGPRSRVLRGAELLEDEERAMKLPGNSRFVKWLNSTPKEAKLSSADKLQVKKWVRNKDSMEDVFMKGLGLNAGMDKALENPKLKIYAAYIDRFNKENPTNKVNMIDMFTKTYGDDVVARAVELNTWYSYTIKTYGQNAEKEMVSVLAAKYGYDGLSRIFAAANPRVVRMRFIALNLETAMGKGWLREGLPPAEIFKLLKLDAGANKLLTNSNVKTLQSYVDMFNSKNPEQYTTMMGVFTQFYGAKTMWNTIEAAKKAPETKALATKWQPALNRQILLDEGLTPGDVFKRLNLDGGMDKLLTSPYVTTLREYMDLFNLKHPDRQTTLMGIFTEFYGVKAMASMLESAKKVPSTEAIATQWQVELRRQMFRARKIQ